MTDEGKKCPSCGAEGKCQVGARNCYHETAIRNYQIAGHAVADVGWRCWNCGYEWGFEIEPAKDRRTQ